MFAQVVSSTSKRGEGVPLVVGVGFSNYSMDWGPGQRMNGITVWADLYPLPGALRDLGFEVEGRDINYIRTIPNLREDTGQFGAIYSLRNFSRIRPYGKFLAGVGSMDFQLFRGFPTISTIHFL